MAETYRMQHGQARIKANAQAFALAEKEYGVPAQGVDAVWGVWRDVGEETTKSMHTSAGRRARSTSKPMATRTDLRCSSIGAGPAGRTRRAREGIGERTCTASGPRGFFFFKQKTAYEM